MDEVVPSPSSLPARPPLLIVSTGFACNNACVFCAQGRLRATPRDPEPTEITGVVATADVVCFVGGEPTLDPALPERIAAHVRAGATRIVVQTNARRLAYASYAAALATAGGGRLSLDVSLQGSTREMHDFHTSVAGSFVQTVTGLRNARAKQLPVGLSVVLTRSNYRHLTEIVRVAQAVGAVAVRAVLVQRFGAARENADRLVPPRSLVASSVRAASAEASRLGLELIVEDASGEPRTGRFPFAGLGAVEPNS